MEKKKELNKREKILILADFIIGILMGSLFFKEQLGMSDNVEFFIMMFAVIATFAIFVYGCIALIISMLFRNKH